MGGRLWVKLTLITFVQLFTLCVELVNYCHSSSTSLCVYIQVLLRDRHKDAMAKEKALSPRIAADDLLLADVLALHAKFLVTELDVLRVWPRRWLLRLKCRYAHMNETYILQATEW